MYICFDKHIDSPCTCYSGYIDLVYVAVSHSSTYVLYIDVCIHTLHWLYCFVMFFVFIFLLINSLSSFVFHRRKEVHTSLE